MRRNSLVIFFCTLLWAGLAQTSPPHIEFLNSHLSSNDKKFESTRIGGLSGIAFKDGLYWAVSDDKGRHGEMRVYGFQVTLSADQFSVEPKKLLLLKGGDGKSFLDSTLDLESIVALKDSFLIASEGLLDQKPRSMPALLEFSSQGQLKTEIKLPPYFLPQRTGKQTMGVRSNGAFEGMSLSPSGNVLWIITEQPLFQDHKTWKMGDKGSVRLLRFKKDKNAWKVDTEYSYPLEPVGAGHNNTIVLGQGAAEILAMSDAELFIMERGVHTSGTKVNYEISLFKVSASPEFAQQPSRKINGKSLVKEKVFDFKTIEGKISDGRGLDNFEGLAFGPEVHGKRTILVVSDNNFTSLQRTLWLALKIL